MRQDTSAEPRDQSGQAAIADLIFIRAQGHHPSTRFARLAMYNARRILPFFPQVFSPVILQALFLALTILSISLFAGSKTAAAQTPHADSTYAKFEALALDFWKWRSISQPVSGDDIPRIQRPTGWMPDWWPSTIEENKQFLVQWEDLFDGVEPTEWSVPRQVDYRLLRSAVARVRWELIVTAPWKSNPLFYVEQTLGSVFDLLLEPLPFDDARSNTFIATLEHIQTTIESAKVNLTEPIRPFAELAIPQLEASKGQLETVRDEIRPHLTGLEVRRLDFVTKVAIESLLDYKNWLEERLPTMSEKSAVGPEAYTFFLREVALMPFTPTQLIEMARQEWERSVAFETIEHERNDGLPELPLAASQEAQIERNVADEKNVRAFLEEKGLLSVPSGMSHYTNAPVPAYLAPLAHMGVVDDLTSASRLDENGVKYINAPSSDLGYFALATSKDSRPILVHEGVPGHYFQLALSWGHDDPLRRFYYDSGANEGIGFYAEEMMLQAGFFDDSPRTREIIYNFMRLRALRVEVDVKLATGEFTISEAADYLTATVPMDHTTAVWEASFFASSPGQAISYQIGKIQIIKFMADARRIQGDRFDLRNFHDFVWLNGNVPIALQRWEYLGLKDEVLAGGK